VAPRTVLLILSIPTLLTAACASANSTTSSKASDDSRCQLSRADSAYLKGGPVYRDCAVDQPAKALRSDVMPNFTPSSLPTRVNNTKCFTAELEFVVDERGIPDAETARIVSTSDPGFAKAWLDVVPNLRFQPAVKDGSPVRQIVRSKQKSAIVMQPVSGGMSTRPPSC
jgi:hypothetical protein